jgi:hypothetical protein
MPVNQFVDTEAKIVVCDGKRRYFISPNATKFVYYSAGHCPESVNILKLTVELANTVNAGLHIPRIGIDKNAAYLQRLSQLYFEIQRLALVPPKPKLFVSAL